MMPDARRRAPATPDGCGVSHKFDDHALDLQRLLARQLTFWAVQSVGRLRHHGAAAEDAIVPGSPSHPDHYEPPSPRTDRIRSVGFSSQGTASSKYLASAFDPGTYLHCASMMCRGVPSRCRWRTWPRRME